VAVVIGAGAGLGAIAFRWLVGSFTQLFSGHADYSAAGRVAHPWLTALGQWFLLVVPVLAGLVYGPLVYRFAPEARGHGVPEVMLAVAQRGGRIPARVSLVKALASALCIGSGGSVGREGPIAQIGAALGSTVGRAVRFTDSQLRVLVASGAAGGIAATFNAPLTGPLFAMELILRDFAVESFGAVVLASVTASAVGRAVLGSETFLELPAFAMRTPLEYLLFVLLAAAVGVVGVAFVRVIYLVEDVCDRAWRGPEWLRPAVGGVLLGGLLLAVPQLYGVGYPVLQGAVEGHYLLGLLLLLLVGKIVATSLTIGIGGSGGVFAPSLYLGAMAGTAFGLLAHGLLPGSTASAGMYGLIGMGAAFAAAARAPITAVVVLFELTGQYSIILPLMTAVVVARLVSRALTRDTIYTLKLRRRGIDLDHHRAAPRLDGLTVGDVLEPLPEPVAAATSLRAASHALALSGHGILPVVGDDGRYHGCVTARAVAEALAEVPAEPTGSTRGVAELAEMPATVTADTPVVDAISALTAASGSGLPVLDSDHRELVGWITHPTVLARMA
jgi:CIC family chloride channel protein